MDAKSLRTWIMSNPRPAWLRVSVPGAQPSRVDINGPWNKVAYTVLAMQPDMVEAMNAEGAVLRAERLDDEEEESDDAPETIETADPMMGTLVIFAKLLADAYKHSTDVAFKQLGDLFASTQGRAESLEKALSTSERMISKLLVENAAQAGADGAGQQSLMDQMLTAFMQGKMQGQEKSTNGAGGKGSA